MSGPPEVSGKGGKLSGSELAELLASAPPRPGNVKVLPLLPLEDDSDKGGAAEEDSELSLLGADAKI